MWVEDPNRLGACWRYLVVTKVDLGVPGFWHDSSPACSRRWLPPARMSSLEVKKFPGFDRLVTSSNLAQSASTSSVSLTKFWSKTAQVLSNAIWIGFRVENVSGGAVLSRLCPSTKVRVFNWWVSQQTLVHVELNQTIPTICVEEVVVLTSLRLQAPTRSPQNVG